MTTIKEEIRALEEKLLHTDFSKAHEIINDLLDDDFDELASNGKLSSREEVIRWLANKDPTLQWLLIDFKIRQITTDRYGISYIPCPPTG